MYTEMSQLLEVILDRCAPPITSSKPETSTAKGLVSCSDNHF